MGHLGSYAHFTYLPPLINTLKCPEKKENISTICILNKNSINIFDLGFLVTTLERLKQKQATTPHVSDLRQMHRLLDGVV